MTSLAVLPFTNMSTDVDNEHFCDGLTEELLNAPSKIDALKVAARASEFTYTAQGWQRAIELFEKAKGAGARPAGTAHPDERRLDVLRRRAAR